LSSPVLVFSSLFQPALASPPTKIIVMLIKLSDIQSTKLDDGVAQDTNGHLMGATLAFDL